MREALELFPRPVPVGAACVGACFGHRDADDWRTSAPDRYCDWVLEADSSAAVATPAGCWRLSEGDRTALWCTGLDFERLCALMRRAASQLAEDERAESALRACETARRAARVAASGRVAPAAFEHWPEASEEALHKVARVAWAAAHARAVRTVDQRAARAGLWRSLHRALAEPAGGDGREEGEYVTLADRALTAACVYAECEAALQSAWHHFEVCRAGAARACAARALERAKAERETDEALVCLERMTELQAAFDTMHSVAQRVDGGGAARVFDPSLLCDALRLPNI